MKTATEELLLTLLWTAQSLSRPRWCNFDETFESWAYREGLGRRLARLERQKILEGQPTTPTSRVWRLTNDGRRLALGGRDPARRWARPWDGRWRLILFDLPVQAAGSRTRLRRFLLQHGFGYLQQSVWVTPDSLGVVRELLRKLPADVESLTLFEGRPCGGESDAAIVAGAWDFPHINGLYDRHLAIVNEGVSPQSRRLPPSLAFRRWARREREAWKAAVRKDPLLPRPLLPPGYQGGDAWTARKRMFCRLWGGFASDPFRPNGDEG